MLPSGVHNTGEITVCMASSRMPILFSFYLRRGDAFQAMLLFRLQCEARICLITVFHELMIFIKLAS